MPVADIAAGSLHSFDLSTLVLDSGSYILYVKAVGKAGLANHMSAAVSYSPVTPPSVSVTISSPANNATVSSPMALSATATSSAPINSVQVYVDGVLAYQQTSATLNTNLTLSAGTHQIAVKGWNTSGGNFVSTITVSVSAVLPPVAKLALNPSVGIAPVTVTAATAGSSAPSGSIASTSLDFGDGTVAWVAAGGSASHIYTAAGTYKVTATVTDNLGHSSSATASATASSVSTAYVKITTPTANATVSSPVHLIADAYSSHPLTAMQVYIDGILKYKVLSSHIDTLLTMSTGTHRLTAQGWDSSGANFKSTIYITVH
jgi:PKD repeat protein